jgi:hypothetical protein
MPTVLEQADALTQQAVELLLAERERIDERLAQLKKDPDAKRRGRPRKDITSQPSQPDTIQPALT